MSKVLRIQKGGYKIIAEQNGSEIRFDPGTGGRVTVTGDLYVEGNQTNINTVNLEIEDRIIILNKGHPNNQNGIIEYGSNDPNIESNSPGSRFSGIMIERGNVDALMVFDEVPYAGLAGNNELSLMGPSFVFKDTTASKNLLPITTNRIQTYGLAENANQHLTLFTGYEGVVKVEVQTIDPNDLETSRPQYHERIIARNNNGLADNDIPNIRFIKEYVRASAGEAVIQRFYRYTDVTTENTYSGAVAKDVGENDDFSGVLFTVGAGPYPRTEPLDGVARIGRFGTENGLLVGPGGFNDNNIRIIIDQNLDPIISTDNSDLTISPETGKVLIKSIVQIEDYGLQFPNPSPVVGENIIFSRQIQGSGGTGLFFANTSTSGELCSAANALVYGLIF